MQHPTDMSLTHTQAMLAPQPLTHTCWFTTNTHTHARTHAYPLTKHSLCDDDALHSRMRYAHTCTFAWACLTMCMLTCTTNTSHYHHVLHGVTAENRRTVRDKTLQRCIVEIKRTGCWAKLLDKKKHLMHASAHSLTFTIRPAIIE